jgi:hypothetical protein
LNKLEGLNEAWFNDAAKDRRIGRDKNEVDDVAENPWHRGEKLKIN